MAEPGDIKDALLYSKEHEWVKMDGTTATVGITDYAQREMGDVVYVDPPVVGDRVAQAGEMGVVESVKTASDIYAPIAGTVAEVNGALASAPELINSDPYGEGWLTRLTVAAEPNLDGLLDAAGYKAYLESQ